MSATAASRERSPSPSRLPPIPGSPTYSHASTSRPIPSTFNLPLPPAPRQPHAVLTKSDLEQSQAGYAELLSSAKNYRIALAALSTAASAFGSALETCARLKEARSEALFGHGGAMSTSFATKGACTADNLLAASGVHHLIANHQQILSETVYRCFEVPLLHDFDQWKRHIEEEEETYQKEAKALSREIQRMEKEGMKLHRRWKSDVGKFRNYLVDMTSKVDGLTSLHASHSSSLLRDSQETSAKIVEASGSLVRAEVDIFEALARKGWNGGGLDELLEKGQDLFSNDIEREQHQDNSKIFTILPKNSILSDPGHDRSSLSGQRQGASSFVEGERYHSLASAVSVGDVGDSGSIFSEESILNRSRGVRPFSPPPMSRPKELDIPKSTSEEEDHRSSKTVIKVDTPIEDPFVAPFAELSETPVEGPAMLPVDEPPMTPAEESLATQEEEPSEVQGEESSEVHEEGSSGTPLDTFTADGSGVVRTRRWSMNTDDSSSSE
ncbi:hypothetical protein F5884DRAFT_274590 [Xylogone sp. PMI_703]|nr:hypothetical protein F5884DRAFT_274590 [Xylogone sp. PMI_703]